MHKKFEKVNHSQPRKVLKNMFSGSLLQPNDSQMSKTNRELSLPSIVFTRMSAFRGQGQQSCGIAGHREGTIS